MTQCVSGLVYAAAGYAVICLVGGFSTSAHTGLSSGGELSSTTSSCPCSQHKPIPYLVRV